MGDHDAVVDAGDGDFGDGETLAEFEQCRMRIQRFRRELLELSTLEDEPRRVVQLNFQLFPLSRDLPDQHDPEDDGDQPAGTKAAAKHDLEEP